MIALIYLDDFLFQFHSLQDARLGSRLLRNIFRLMGLLEHPTKSDWAPSQLREHLGLTIDSDTNTLSLPPSKISKLRAVASEILQRCSRSSRWISKRRMASFCGLVESTSIVVPEARMHIAKCYDCMTQTPGWNGRIKISHGALKDVRYFIALCKRMTSVPINLPTQQLLLQTDASSTGWGAVLRRDMNPSTKGSDRHHSQGLLQISGSQGGVCPVVGPDTQDAHMAEADLHPIEDQSTGGRVVSPMRQGRLATMPNDFSTASGEMGTTAGGSICRQGQHLSPTVQHSGSRPPLDGDGCVAARLAALEKLCASALGADPPRAGPLVTPTPLLCDHSPSVDSSALVCAHDSNLSQEMAVTQHPEPLQQGPSSSQRGDADDQVALHGATPHTQQHSSSRVNVELQFDAFWSALFEGTATPPWLAFVTGPLLHGVDNLLEHLRSTWLAWVQSSRDAMRIRIRKYFVFCASYKELPFPSRPAKLYAYIKWLQKEGDISYKTAPQYVAALSSVQRWLGHEKYSVFDGQSKLLLTAWRNLQVDTDSVDEVTIFTTSLLFQVVDLGIRTADTALLRSATAVVVAYIFFGRSSSHTWVRGNDLLVDLQGTSISFREREFKAKRRRSGVYRLRTFKISTCPSVGNLVRRFLATKRQCYETASEFETQLLFRLPGEAATLTRATFAAWFHSVLAELSLPPTLSQLTPHSLRRGSVTEAFAIGVVTDKLCHWGGWSGSSNTIWKYIDRSFLPSAEGLLLFQWMLGTQTQGLVSISDLVLGLPPATRQKLE
ncbi:hypothetical protein BSKO_12152 [Bryopsis sp. KO-2023]|nr:hypothetical protein BSKO_12152 [Bryopsis sp. KO-2023]